MNHRLSDKPLNIEKGGRPYQVLVCIYEFSKKHRYPPSYRAIGEFAEITSTSVVAYYLDRLQQFGYVERDPVFSRTVHITKQGEEVIGVASTVCPTCHRDM